MNPLNCTPRHAVPVTSFGLKRHVARHRAVPAALTSRPLEPESDMAWREHDDTHANDGHERTDNIPRRGTHTVNGP